MDGIDPMTRSTTHDIKSSSRYQALPAPPVYRGSICRQRHMPLIPMIGSVTPEVYGPADFTG